MAESGDSPSLHNFDQLELMANVLNKTQQIFWHNEFYLLLFFEEGEITRSHNLKTSAFFCPARQTT
jgi:hypothetical protein